MDWTLVLAQWRPLVACVGLLRAPGRTDGTQGVWTRSAVTATVQVRTPEPVNLGLYVCQALDPVRKMSARHWMNSLRLGSAIA
jgi:hypothetical protein